MSAIFISYKREDQSRVSQLVEALHARGFTTWWDQHLAAGENWRHQLQDALDGAKCVIVIWSRESVGPAGDFVRDEAGRAKRRGALVPVKLDDVTLPLGFGEIQAIDLTRWKGDASDPFFADLCAAVAAKLEGRPAPRPQAPAQRLIRRVTYGSLLTAVAFCAAALGFNFFGAQDRLCGVPFLQPFLSDSCGAAGLGNRPTQAERIAWHNREPGNCGALRTHIEQFPTGVFRGMAADLLAARQVASEDVWTGATRQLRLYVGHDDAVAKTEDDARVAALGRAQVSAEQLCRGFAAATNFRYVSARPTAETWNCSRNRAGVSCGFEGQAVCAVEELSVRQTEFCGS